MSHYPFKYDISVLDLAERMHEPREVCDLLAQISQKAVPVTEVGKNHYAYSLDVQLLLEGARAVASKTAPSSRLPSIRQTQARMLQSNLECMVSVWHENFGDGPVSAADLFPFSDHFPALVGLATTERGKRTALGMRIRRHRGEMINGFFIKYVGAPRGGAMYRLVVLTASSQPDF